MGKIVIAGKQKILESMLPLLIQLNRMLVEVREIQQSNLAPPRRTGKPMIKLHFQSLPHQRVEGRKGYGQISFRVMESTPATMLPAESLRYAQRIMQKMGTPPFVWKKGKRMVSYTDWDAGLQLQILSLNDTEGEKVVRQVLDTTGTRFERELLGFGGSAQPEQRYSEKPGKEIVLGESVNSLHRRPNIDVTFRYATLDVGMKHVLLVDLTGDMGVPLV